MTYSWIVSVPVWGKRYLDVFFTHTLHSLANASETLGRYITTVIHTDTPHLFPARFGNVQLQVLPVVDAQSPFDMLSASHRDVIQKARLGQIVALLTADICVSPEIFVASESYINKGYKLVCLVGMRCLEDAAPPIFETSREMLSWGWDNPHPMTVESTWPSGRSYDIWRMYFQSGDNVVARVCLPHPFAFIKDKRYLNFRATVDVNFMRNFKFGEIYLVTDPDDAAMIELSPITKGFGMVETMQERLVSRANSVPGLSELNVPHQRFMLQKRVVIKGKDVSCGEEPVVQRLLHGV